MFTVTTAAAHMIIQLRDEAGLTETAGLRIAFREDHPALHMGLMDRPLVHDTVIRTNRVNIFLGPRATKRLQDQILDGRSNPAGSAFYLRG